MRRSGKRVLLVDDSPHTRRVLREMLETDPLVGDVDGAGNGRVALDKALNRPPDLVLLDLQMPVMDGFTFLRLFRRHSEAPVLVVSSLSDLTHVEKALELGASGFVAKPADAYRDLKGIIRELRLKIRDQFASPQFASAPGASSVPRSMSGAVSAPGSDAVFPLVVIGASSGGPPTLQYLLTGLSRRLDAAVLIAQHLPPGFTRSFAQRLDALVPHTVSEARNDQVLAPGEIVIGPGGLNLGVCGRPGQARLRLVEPRGGQMHVPSVDHLFASAAEVLGARVTGFILTGMGSDGAEGVRAVKGCGGRVYAESEETAAVYGMPREAAATGCVDEVLPLPEIAVRLIEAAGHSTLEEDCPAA